MVMKSIFKVSCFVVMALVIGTKQQEIPPGKVIHLEKEMSATCKNLMNGTCVRVNQVVFNVNCEQTAYRDTFCQINRALLNCKGYNESHYLSYFHKNVNCTSKRSLIPLKDFCSNMLDHIDKFYRKCATIRDKGK